MKKLKHFKFLVSYWWIILLAGLGVITLVCANPDGGVSETENRSLQGQPAFSWQAVKDGTFQQELEDYLADQIPFRSNALSVSSTVMGVFDIRTEQELILTTTVEEQLDDTVGDDEVEDTLWEEQTVSASAEDTATFAAETETGTDTSTDETAAEGTVLTTGTETPAETETGETAVQGAAETELTDETEDSFSDEGGEIAAADANEGEEIVLADADVADVTVTRYFYYTRVDGKTSAISSFGAEAIQQIVNVLNAYKAALPDDGTVTFTWVPDSPRANKWLFNTDIYNGWYTDVDDTLAAAVDEGVYVYSSVNELNSHMQAGEQVYYKTDHHWSGLGAYYMQRKMIESKGSPSVEYYDFAYTTYTNYRGSIAQSTLSLYHTSVYDTLEVPAELSPVIAAEYRKLNKLERTVRYMEPERNSYAAFLGGTHGPFFVVETGFHTGRNALIISDSFGNAFFPYLVPYYDKVCQLDLREDYAFIQSGGAKISEYLEYWEIDDVYFVVSQGKGISSKFMRVNAKKYL